MPPSEPDRPQSRVRRWFRRCRIATLLLALVLTGGLVYLNQVGLPDFLRRPLLEKIRARGLDLQMSTLKLHFYRGLVADDVKIGAMNDTAGPRLTAKEAEVKLNSLALLKLKLQVRAVGLQEGKLVWPVADAVQPARQLALEKIQFTLRFPAGDEWEMDDFHAAFQGVNFALAGAITNASAIRDWPIFHAAKPPPAGIAQLRLRRLADSLEKIHFTHPPRLRIVLSGDARDLQSFSLRLMVSAPDADTPWGRLNGASLYARVFPAAPRERSRAALALQAVSAETPWAGASDLTLDLQLVSNPSETNLVDGRLSIRAAHAESKWAGVTNVLFTAEWVHTLTNAIPLSGRGELHGDSAVSRWASGKKIQLTATLATPTNPPPTDASWDWWTNLAPFHLDWSCALAQLDTERLGGEDIACAGNWRAPLLTVTNLHVRLPEAGGNERTTNGVVLSGGQFNARARLDVATREAGFEVASDFDPHRIAPMLPEKSRRWLWKYTYATRPQISGSGAVTLAAWTNRTPDWRGEVLPTLRLAGQLAVTNGAYLGAPCDWVTTHLFYTNMVWQLPDLVAGRPEGLLKLVHVADDRTHDYYFGVHSTIDPRALRPVLNTNAQRGLDYFALTGSPMVEGEVWGRWREQDRIGFRGHVTVTNFAFRAQTADSFDSTLRFTNNVLELLDPRLTRGTQFVNATTIVADFDADRVYFTNGLSSAEPLVVARGIGPETGRSLEPYVFTQPPLVRVNGYAPLHDTSDADLRFVVDGGPFEWWKFKIPHIAGEVHWSGETLDLTNITMSAYDGTAEGQAHFDLSSDPGTDFQFDVSVTNADLRLLMADLSAHTNKLEGRFTGRLTITNANSADEWSWDGSGNVGLRDGLIWEIPIFGVLSKGLDAITPGLGSSRISAGSAQFVITNGVIFSDSLEMRSPTMRLAYHGTVDFAGRVDMRVNAEPFGNVPGLGPLFTLVFLPVSKIFEYKVTGTLAEPRSETVYIPKIFMMPLHPFRTIEDLFSGDAGKTNAPPVFKELPPEDQAP